MTIWQWSAAETAEKIRKREVSCVEVTQAHLARLDAINPALNAVVVPLHEQALARARELDAGRHGLDPLPPLYGVPVTIKINVDQAGQANSDGIPAYRDQIASEDAPVVANLRRDGAVILGQTNTPEFSIRWFTSNPLHGASLNPWNAELTPGGSSGAAAAAVAAGIGCIAHGNDMGGSLRHPAYCCGVTTIRPSFGRIANGNPSATGGRPPVSQLLSVQGPIARSVADVRLGLASMARRSAFDADWTPARSSGRLRQGPLRVAFQLDPFGDGVAPGVELAMRQAREALLAAGHRVEEVTLPDAAEAAALWGRVTMAEVAALFQSEMDQHGSGPLRETVRAYGEHFGPVGLEQVMRDLMARNRIRRAWSQLFERHDLVLLPVSAELAFPNELDFRQPDQIPRLLRAQRFAYLINLLGLPSVALPTGLLDGVPLGVQLIGAQLDDDCCLQGAQAIESQLGTLAQQLWQQGISRH